MRSQRIILISLMVTLASGGMAYYLPADYRKRTLWGKTKAGGAIPPMRFFIGTGIVFFGISAVGEFKPALAGPFATLVMTTAGLFNGVPALEYLMTQGQNPIISGAAVGPNDFLTTPERLAPIQTAADTGTGGGFANLNIPMSPKDSTRPHRRVSGVNAKGQPVVNVKVRMKANSGG